MWRWADVKMSRCERRCERRYEERWADERRCERRYEDEQMWRWADVREDVKMSRCEDEQMWEKMWRWADVKMSRCEDEKVWRWEGEIQTPTIGRTLRSDALGKKSSFLAGFQPSPVMVVVYGIGLPTLIKQRFTQKHDSVKYVINVLLCFSVINQGSYHMNIPWISHEYPIITMVHLKTWNPQHPVVNHPSAPQPKS